MKNVKNLTLEERVTLLEKQMSNLVANKELTTEFALNVDSFKSSGEPKGKEFLNYVESISEKIEDEHKNIYVKLPTIYINTVGRIIYFSFNEIAGYIKLQPQLVSKYKNSWIDGKVRSIPNVAPDLNQFSYLKSLKLCRWVNGEMLNWKTVLYFQIMWAYAYETKENNDILPNEQYEWSNERDCAFGDTGKGIGEFLGIEQLFTSGRNLVDLSNPETELWGLYKEWNFDKDFNPNEKFALWGDYNPDEESEAGFFSYWRGRVYDAWTDDDGALRLCKKPYEGC